MSDTRPQPDTPPGPQPRTPTPGGWGRLARGLAPRATRGQLLAALLCGVLGFALVVQLGQTDDVSLTTLRQSDLVRILDDVTQRQDRLAQEAADLEQTRDELLTSTDRLEAARQQAQQRVDVLGILTGTAPAVGPGIRLTLSGDEVDARTLLETVQELRDAGAEAIQVDDVRVVASTSFTDAAGGKVAVGGKEIARPFVFLAIGDPQTLATAMSFPGGVVEQVEPEGTARVDQLDEVRVDALRSPSEPQYARPADPATPTSEGTSTP
jgi:uncharacterized protein YlxW (UPF0749 family)